MVSAVFHSPRSGHASSARGAASARPVAAPVAATPSRPAGRDWRPFWMAVLPPLMGLGLLIGLWALVSITTKGSIPSPYETGVQALSLIHI